MFASSIPPVSLLFFFSRHCTIYVCFCCSHTHLSLPNAAQMCCTYICIIHPYSIAAAVEFQLKKVWQARHNAARLINQTAAEKRALLAENEELKRQLSELPIPAGVQQPAVPAPLPST